MDYHHSVGFCFGGVRHAYILWSLELPMHVTPLVLMGTAYNPLHKRIVTALKVRLCYKILAAKYEGQQRTDGKDHGVV